MNLKELLYAKAKKELEIENARAKIKSSDSADEVRSLGETLDKLVAELRDLDTKIAELDDTNNQDSNERSFNPIATYVLNGKEKRTGKELSTLEERQAFKDYVQTGKMSDLLKRADAEQTSGDLGVLLPKTIVQEIIKGIEKVYGHLYSKVKKTNIKGGVQYPIGDFEATFYWGGTAGTDKEHGVSETQKAGAVNNYVEFTYHIGEVRIAQSLLQSILSLEVFEREIVNALVESYVKAMDIAIIKGSGTNQPTGILTEANKSGGRIPATNIITVNETEMKDWKTLKKKLFAKIPLSMRALRPEFVMNATTFEANLECLEDANGNPIARTVYNTVNGDETSKFNGREVVFVEDDIFKPFDDATAGTDFFGMYWVPEKAYAINTNLEFGYKKYFDEDNNKWITKGLVIVDGKPLDTKYIWLLKKGTKTSV